MDELKIFWICVGGFFIALSGCFLNMATTRNRYQSVLVIHMICIFVYLICFVGGIISGIIWIVNKIS